jgi:hypothetical protein
MEDGTIVKFEATQLDKEVDVADFKEIISFNEVTTIVESLASSVMNSLKKIAPDKSSIEFGVELAMESGKLTALVVKGSATANLKITLEWDKSGK